MRTRLRGREAGSEDFRFRHGFAFCCVFVVEEDSSDGSAIGDGGFEGVCV